MKSSSDSLCDVINCEKLRVTDSVRDFGVPQPPKWQRIGNKIKAAFVTARADRPGN
jgi:hypothetical protein